MDTLIPVFLLMLVGECAFAWFRGHRWYRMNDTVANLSTGVVMLLTMGYFEPSRAVYEWIEQHASTGWLFESTVWQLVIALVVLDFILYWIHRIAHINGFLWAVHEVHHQSEEMNYSVALRHSSFLYINSWLFLVPFAMAGFSLKVLLSVHVVTLLYEFLVHTKAFSAIPWLDKVLVMPVHHRVHHACNEVYIDRNFGSMLIVWDRLFGTFVDEATEHPVRYGVKRRLPSHSPLVANLIGFRDWLRVVGRRLLGRPPSRSATPAAGAPADRIAIPRDVALYGLVQFLLSTLLLADYLFGLSGAYIVNPEVELGVLLVAFICVPTIYDGDDRMWWREKLRSMAGLVLGSASWLAQPGSALPSLALMLWGGLSLVALWRLHSPSFHQTA